MLPTASLPIVPWVSLVEFDASSYRIRRGDKSFNIPFPEFLKPSRTYFLVLTMIDLNGKKYEGSTSASKDSTWEYDRITLPDKPRAKITFNVYRSRWRGIPLVYERIAAGEVTIESLANGQRYIELSEVDSKKYTIPSGLRVSVERGSGPHPPQPNRYTPGKRWRLRRP
ncbi:hypothetical protein BDZ89DRAFT_1072301 [Hymenopellis radicata]|nr:hypothetical protein BDZ89DRAFT_1072301 [Hymenopellis radicata]